MKLYMLLLGASPAGRHTEQHDIFFCIGENLKSLVPDIIAFWPEAKSKLHIDAWREVTRVGEFQVRISLKNDTPAPVPAERLFFINLGGYKKNEFDEFHYKMIVAATDKGDAIRQSKKTAFYIHTGFKGATSHVDDKYGVDVDDFFEIQDILPPSIRAQYSIELSAASDEAEDQIHLGYFKLDKL